MNRCARSAVAIVFQPGTQQVRTTERAARLRVVLHRNHASGASIATGQVLQIPLKTPRPIVAILPTTPHGPR